jgi:hypothetical protein
LVSNKFDGCLTARERKIIEFSKIDKSEIKEVKKEKQEKKINLNRNAKQNLVQSLTSNIFNDEVLLVYLD